MARKNFRKLWVSGQVAGGAQILSPIFDCSGLEQILVVIPVTDVARSLTGYFFDMAGIVYFNGGGLGASSPASGVFCLISPDVSIASPYNSIAYTGPMPAQIRLSLDAGGAATANIIVYGR